MIVAKNLTFRTTVVDIVLGDDDPVVYVLHSQESLDRFLFALAVEHWDGFGPGEEVPIPSSRKAVIDTFFSDDSGNQFFVVGAVLMSNDAARRRSDAARRKAYGSNKPYSFRR